MSVPPGSRRKPTFGGAEAHASSAGPAKRRRPLPRGAFSFDDSDGAERFFGEAEAAVVLAATDLPLAPGITLSQFGEELSRIGHQFLWEKGLPSPSAAGERAAWAREVAQRARALLESFDTDPETLEPLPSADLVTVLFGFDQPPSSPPPTADEQARRG